MCIDLDKMVSKYTSAMWTIQNGVEIFDEDVNKNCFEDETEPIFKKFKKAMKNKATMKVQVRRLLVEKPWLCLHMLANS